MRDPSEPTSFVGLFSAGDITKIEIPIIQRDYAQGRQDDAVSKIRRDFLRVLHDALTEGMTISLDFIYGEVTEGTMLPLDGQQRLTTLFLLHWYVAARAGVGDGGSEFLRGFTYETRYSCRDFCRKLVEHPPAFRVSCLSDWIRDQSWFFSAWRHDPTIQSMLVVIDNIHDLFESNDAKVAWQRLADVQNPTITFHFLPIKEMGLSDDLYIKMNSRGKPLTEFEQFKANFEKIISSVSVKHYDELIQKIDNDWADLLWPLRDDSNIIDDRFMRYFRYVTDILTHWTEIELPKDLRETDVDQIAELVYGKGNPRAELNQRFLFDALDCWAGMDVAAFFEGVFVESGYEPTKVAIYGRTDLFSDCCKNYGRLEGRNRSFPLQRMIVLFGVLLHQIHDTKDFPRRVRILRNLVFGSENEIRLENMSRLR